MLISNILKLLILTILLQFAVVSNVFFAPWIPNILTILVLFLGFYESSIAGVLTVFFCGLLFDMAASSVLGPSSFAAILLFLVISMLSRRVFIDAIFSGIFLGLIIGFFFALIRGAMLSPFIAQDIFIISVKEALVTAMISPLVLIIFRKTYLKKTSSNASFR